MVQQCLIEFHQENQTRAQAQIGVIHCVGEKERKILEEKGFLQMSIQQEYLIKCILRTERCRMSGIVR